MKHRRKGFGISLLIFTVFFVLLSVPSYAEENQTGEITPDSYVESILEELPDDARELIPSADDTVSMVKEADASYLVSLTGHFFQKAFLAFFKNLLFFVAVVILSAVGEILEDSFASRHPLFSKITVFALAMVLFSRLLSLSREVTDFVENTRKYMTVTGGVLSAVSFLGGSVGEGGLTVGAISILLVLTVGLAAKWLMPVLRICFATTLATAVSEGSDLRRFSSLARKTFLFLLALMGTVSSLVFSFQHAVVQAEDSVAARALRFTASQSLPLVGNVVSESIRTLSSGVLLIRSTTGAVGILGLILLALHPLASLIAAKAALSLGGSLSALLGSKSCETMFDEVGKILDMMIGTVVILLVFNLYLLAVYMKGIPAIAS